MFERHGMVQDISPVGVAANMHLSVSSGNFGIQEYTPVNEALQEVFTGCVQVKDGFAYVSDKPGWVSNWMNIKQKHGQLMAVFGLDISAYP